MYRTSLTILFSISLVSFIIAEDDLFQSPCPRLFVYETESTQPGKWFGILTMVSSTDARGAWVRLVFDRPPLELGNWYGDVTPVSEKVYFIINLEDDLKAHVPKTIRFYVTHEISEPPPKVLSFRVNEKQVCPEERITGTTTVSLKLKTGSYKKSNPMNPPPVVTLTAETGNSPVDDDVFVNDLYQLLSKSQETGENEICGTVVTRPRPLVIHGQPTYEGEFPWHAAIYHVKQTKMAYICGASLISNNFVITVAHCVTKVRSTTPVRPEKLIVYLGKHYLNQFSNEGIQDRNISQIILHPQYNANNYSNDIALLKLSHPADYSDYVRPICLWEEPTDLNRILEKQGNVVGWGFDETGKVIEELMQTGMTAVSQATCLFSFPEFYSRYSSENNYCAGFRNGTSVCNGDSGGGMVYPKSNSNSKNPVWQLRGLVSVSSALHGHFKCDSTNYVVFTDTAKYLDWIRNIYN